MASRIHNFSYSGPTGLLTFTPCLVTEVACKVYIKALSAKMFSTSAVSSLKLVTKSSSGENLPRAFWYAKGPMIGQSIFDIYLVGGCSTTMIDYQNSGVTDTQYGWWQELSQFTYSGTGTENWPTVRSVKWHVPEYFYLKPNDTLTVIGFQDNFSIDLMAISESN